MSYLLPWQEITAQDAFYKIKEVYLSRYPEAATGLLDAAFFLADAAHAGQSRRSGEDYIFHPLAVARIVADLGLDDVTIAAALLHDAVEDTDVSLDELTSKFGPAVAYLVDGVTKVEALPTESKTDSQAATLQKMFVAVASDLRVLIIKLADRAHNMSTLSAQKAHKHERIARETLDIYVPLAARLGMQDIKRQLEDMAFAALHPKWYSELDRMVHTRSPQRDAFIEDLRSTLKNKLYSAGIHSDIVARPKELWSIYNKMVAKGYEFDELHDLVGVRIITDSVKDCYAALGVIHATYRPVDGRFKDYIATPKHNLYQSLHTTVIGPDGRTLEVQVRTAAMDARAKYGVASHWVYKEGGRTPDTSWVNTLVDWQQVDVSPSEFLASLIRDLSSEDIYVLTPKGDVKTLPLTATALDMAYAIHTEVGHKTVGARVNGKLSPLPTVLNSGDTVEIITAKSSSHGPSRDWLNFVVTPKARHNIKQYFAAESREDDTQTGKEVLLEALKKAHRHESLIDSSALAKVSEDLGYKNVTALYLALGQGKTSTRSIVDRLIPPPPRASAPRKEFIKAPTIVVAGQRGLAMSMARCCYPVPGDRIAGFVTVGRGITIHRTDCSNFQRLNETDPARVTSAEYVSNDSTSATVTITIKSLDRPDLLRDILQVFSEHKTALRSSSASAFENRFAKIICTFDISDRRQFETIMSAISKLESVYSVYKGSR